MLTLHTLIDGPAPVDGEPGPSGRDGGPEARLGAHTATRGQHIRTLRGVPVMYALSDVMRAAGIKAATRGFNKLLTHMDPDILATGSTKHRVTGGKCMFGTRACVLEMLYTLAHRGQLRTKDAVRIFIAENFAPSV